MTVLQARQFIKELYIDCKSAANKAETEISVDGSAWNRMTRQRCYCQALEIVYTLAVRYRKPRIRLHKHHNI